MELSKVYYYQIIKACETIIKNAESIVRTEPSLENINITISLRPDEIPNIEISKSIGVENLNKA